MYKIVSLQDVANKLDDTKHVAFDTETDGFYGTIELAQFYQAGWDEVLIVRKPEPIHLASVLQKQPFVAHVAHYDITTIQQQTGVAWVPANFDCSFYAARLHFYAQDSFSLDDVIYYVLHRDIYKEAGLNKSKLQSSDWSGHLTEEQLLYAAIDVYHLLDVWEVVKPATEQFNYTLDMLFTKSCLEFQWNGMPIIPELIEERIAENLHKLEELNLPINPQSWQQVRPYCNTTKSDALSLLTEKLQGNEKAGHCVDAKKLLKQNSFLRKFLDTAIDDIIYGKFLPSARSGRCTSKDQNLQQIPRKIKSCFGLSPESGEVFIYADYSQLELRGVTVIANETRMERLFREGKDVHGHTTEAMIAKEYTPTQRQVGKTCNFNLVYGGGHHMLGSILIKESEILLPEVTLASYKRGWQKLYPSVYAWQQRGIKAWRNDQPWATPLGRRYLGNLMTDQLNIQVQGFGAEVAKLATHYMYKDFGNFTDVEHKLRDFVHDAWIFSSINDPETYTEVANVIAAAMKLSWTECCKSVHIKDLPMPVDVYVGYNWGTIESDYIAKFTF